MEAHHLVIAADGTPIACSDSGSGPPVVVVHGTSGDRSSFRLVEPLLASRFTIHALDRRGRGASGDSSDDFRIEQEFADVAAVVDSVAGPVDLFGHSYGATVALGAALETENLGRLVLYEPAPGVPAIAPELIARLEALLAEGRREELVSGFFLEVAGLDLEELEHLRALPTWPARVEAAHTIPRELRAEQDYEPDPAVFAHMQKPVMLLSGSESPEWAKRGTDVTRSLLPNSRVVTLDGQGHIATLTAPDRLTDEIVRFLNG